MTHIIKPRLHTVGTRFGAACVGALAAVAVLTFVVAHPSPSTAAPVKANAIVSSATSNLGRILVDRSGRTLYLFEKDTRGASACKGSCATYWPPVLTTGKPLAGANVRASLLGTTKRPDGTRQVTYNHHPLYTFKLDTKAGQTKGQDSNAFGGDWYVVAPSGVKIDKGTDAVGTTPAGSGSGGGNAGYVGDDAAGNPGADAGGNAGGYGY